MTNTTLIAALVAISAGLVAQASQAKPGDGARNMPTFEKLDINGDGVLTVEELAGLRKGRNMFERVDADGNGMISAEEFEATRTKMKHRMKHNDERPDGAGEEG